MQEEVVFDLNTEIRVGFWCSEKSGKMISGQGNRSTSKLVIAPW